MLLAAWLLLPFLEGVVCEMLQVYVCVCISANAFYAWVSLLITVCFAWVMVSSPLTSQLSVVLFGSEFLPQCYQLPLPLGQLFVLLFELLA